MTVTVYTKPSCNQCTATYKDLTNKGIEHNIVDISQDDEALAYVRSLGYLQAPVVVAGEDHWSGFRPDKIENLQKALASA